MKKKTFEDRFVANFDKFTQDQILKHIQSISDEKRHLASLLEGIGFALFEISMEGNVIYLNRSAQKLIQMPLEKIKGESFKSIDIDISLKFVFNQSISGTTIRGKNIFLTNQKDSIFEVNSFPKVISGKIESFIFIVQDESEYHHNQKKNLHDKSIVSLAMLTAGVAHEIKNPLGSLDLHVQLIKRFVKSKAIPDKAELFDLIDVVGEEIHRLNNIVNSFLFSVRPVKPKKKPENLNEITTEVLKVIQPEIEDNNITMRFEPNDKLENIPLDKNYIKQSLINVIQNAIQAIDQNKKNHSIQLKTIQDKEKISLCINDNGVGIDDKDFDNIFDPFFSTKSKGTGLGLTIVYKIINEHGGKIVLDSTKGKGTKFRLDFPRKPSEFLPENSSRIN